MDRIWWRTIIMCGSTLARHQRRETTGHGLWSPDSPPGCQLFSAVVFGPRAVRKGGATVGIVGSILDDALQLLDLVGLCARLYRALSLGYGS
jgi:hypothetical protein